MHKFKWQQRTKRFILVLVSLFTLVSILITGVSSYASTPDAAYITKIEGTGLVIGERTSRDRTPASKNQQLRGNKVLYVPGNGSLAYLGFIVDAPLDTTGLLVSAGPSKTPSEWSFPCTAKGGFTIAWKDGSDRGCEAGVKVQSSSKKGELPNNNLQASRRLLAQAEDEVTVVPTPGKSTIQTADTFTGISVNVLVGDVRVKSAKNPAGRLVKAGERYNYPQDTITPIDINPILNSPEMQEFLNPDNWSSPAIPQRIADDFSEQLGEMRTALGKGAPAVASNSGNNNNPSQSPTASNTSNNNNDLCGSGIITRRIVYSETSAGQIPYSMWLDYTHGSDMGHPNCGRVHYEGYGYSSVFLVDGKGACVVKTPFEENPDGSLNSVPGKYNDCPIGFTPLPPSLVLSNP
ncbi:MAG: hypothetical protein EAZ78_24415 [Oscillatoriales cyanobacterium]|nr:MAG: hypothetical protein EAZ78_24415 [Oscillatoriales cyanobacterium]TAF62944.1 MAG: hypothetical protein EAZ59_21980 [Oscillatoriales cyanobacterium]